MESSNNLDLDGFPPISTIFQDNQNLTGLNSGSYALDVPWSVIPEVLCPINRSSPLVEQRIPPDAPITNESSPFERWYTSSEDEGFPTEALAALASSLVPPEPYATRADISSGSSLGSSRSIGSHQSLSSRRKQKCQYSANTASSLAIDANTIEPEEQNLADGSSKGKGKHKAKNQHQATLSSPKQQNKYQCTFCTASFTTKGNWNRHEDSIHLILDTWICAPNGPWDRNKKTATCVFCQKPNTISISHDSCAHACTYKSLQSRTFSRRDHLDQHLLHVHHVTTTATKTMTIHSWKRSRTPPLVSRCGFCDMKLGNWKERNSHIAAHFEEGYTMSNWKGDWGLEEEWRARLNSVTLPEQR
ncbi:hypothetical protein BZA77DRAFT_58802 [Pyronema omphalodes]|nr:hypothetical protein BZA77DRAFT_58802 [Pyronema omphalodes]